MIKTTLAAWFIAAESDWPEFGCIAADGKWNLPKLRRFLEDAKYDGYTAIRVLPYLLGDPAHNGSFQLNQTNFLPFHFDGQRFDLSRLNQTWLDNLAILAFECNSYGMRLRVDLFDDCHGKAAIGPWRNNLQGLTTWRGFGPLVKNYVDAVALCLKGKNYGLEIENEATERDFHGGQRFEALCKKVIDFFNQIGASWDSIGGEFMFPHSRTYKPFIDEDLGPFYRINKLSVMHNFGDKEWAAIGFRLVESKDRKRGRKYGISNDGKKPRGDENDLYLFWVNKFPVAPELYLMDSEIEICPHSYPGDPNGFDVCRHAGRGVLRAAGYSLPERPLPPPPVIPEPVTPPVTPPVIEEENMQYTRLLSGIKWKWPPVEIRFWSWIVQNWNQKTIRHITVDGMIVLSAFFGLYQLIKTIVKIF